MSEATPAPRILVTGATGYIGSRLIPLLVARGAQVRALAREPRRLSASLRALRGPNGAAVAVATGDLLRPESLGPALQGIDTAYYLVHSMTTGSDDTFAARDREAAWNFATACAAAGVRRIIYLGGLGDPEAELSEHLASRHETGDVLRRGTVPVTELRAAIIVGAGSASFEIIRDLAAKLPVMVCPRWVRSRCEPIAIGQVLDYLVGVLDEPRTVGRTFEIGGGDVLTYEEMMRQCAAVMGKRIRILTVPVLTPRLSAYWLNLVTTVPMSLALPLVEGLRNDVITRDQSIRDLVSVPRMTYPEMVRLALSEEAAGPLASRWTHAVTAPARAVPAARGRELGDERIIAVAAAPERVFDVIARAGGDTGWYFADGLWRLRGAIDRLLGGVGMRRGRPHPSAVAVGDPIDFWRVEDVVPHELLRLRAEMRLPGEARLEFRVAPADGGAVLTQRAAFEPAGWWGRLYWYLLWPAHVLIFGGMARAIARAAESRPDA